MIRRVSPILVPDLAPILARSWLLHRAPVGSKEEGLLGRFAIRWAIEL